VEGAVAVVAVIVWMVVDKAVTVADVQRVGAAMERVVAIWNLGRSKNTEVLS
jgi:hypothetical protein